MDQSGRTGDYSASGDVFKRGSMGVPVLTYHKLGSPPDGVKIKNLYVSKDLFAWQIHDLRANGISTISLDDRKEFGQQQKGVVMSFDDGSCTVFDHGLPLLVKNQMHSIMFLVAGELGGSNRWDVVANQEVEDRLMDVSQIRDWLAAGQEIGAHTMTHPKLTKIPSTQAREEIMASRKKLEDTFGIQIRHFCYPYGKWSNEICNMVAEAGYETAVTLDAGNNLSHENPFALKRWGVRHPSRRFRNVLSCLQYGPPIQTMFCR